MTSLILWLGMKSEMLSGRMSERMLVKLLVLQLGSMVVILSEVNILVHENQEYYFLADCCKEEIYICSLRRKAILYSGIPDRILQGFSAQNWYTFLRKK